MRESERASARESARGRSSDRERSRTGERACVRVHAGLRACACRNRHVGMSTHTLYKCTHIYVCALSFLVLTIFCKRSMRFFLLAHSDSMNVRWPIFTSIMCNSADVTYTHTHTHTHTQHIHAHVGAGEERYALSLLCSWYRQMHAQFQGLQHALDLDRNPM